MKLTPAIIDEFIELHERELGALVDREEAEQMIRNLLTLYHGLYEWRFHREQLDDRTADAAH